MVLIVPVNVWQCVFQKNTRLPILLVPKPTPYQNPGERRETKGKPARKRSSLAVENRKSKASVIFLSLLGH